MSQKIAWGILGTGAIAKCFANNLPKSQTGQLLAVASRSQESADKFGNELNVPVRHGSYDALLADKNVQAVYISTPHPMHAEWAIKAAQAGKHVLVEKPSAVNAAQLMAMIEAATVHNVFFMEAFMYRCHPQTARLVELLREGVIGKVGVIQATFSFQSGFSPTSRLWANDYAGGGIMDVGGYAVSMARLLAGAVSARPFANPTDVSGSGKLHPETRVDEYAVGTLKFDNDVVAQIATGVGINQDNVVRIFGTEGSILVPNPWTADRVKGGEFKIIVRKKGQPEPQEIVINTEVTAFTMEADVVGRAILAGKQQADAPAMSWDDSMGNLRTLDRWRQAVGVSFDIETPKAYPQVTVSGKPLTRRADAPMTYGKIPGLDRPVSRLIMGCDNQGSFSHAAVMFDDFFEQGGNTFDTAWIYGGGRQEILLGQWIKLRGVRDQVNVIVKGAHTPMCDPHSIDWQLKQSLERLQIDQADIYIMHRDNPEIPAGEFVECLNAHVKAGRIKVFGGSNWTLSRVEQANAYARSKGLQGFSVVSNNFSLARMVDPIWKGCVHSSDAESRAWFRQTQMPLLSWSSQARGFFVPGRAHPDKRDDKEMVRCWYAPDNFERLERATLLAKKKGVDPINIAAAYVLNQPFPTFALIGPRTLSETRTSLPALRVKLTEEELKYLSLEE